MGNRLDKYGLSCEQFEEMRSRQDGKCAVCRYERELVIDHCHGSGIVRGLLCSNCNTALGLLGEDPDVLRIAALYVEMGALAAMERFLELASTDELAEAMRRGLV